MLMMTSLSSLYFLSYLGQQDTQKQAEVYLPKDKYKAAEF